VVTEAQSQGSGSVLPEPPLWVSVGALDSAGARQVRQVLARAVTRNGSRLVVDLAGLDDRHELTMFALLVETSRQATSNGGDLTVVNAPSRLATILTASHVPVHRAGPLPPRPTGTLTITLGAGQADDRVGLTEVRGD
jgi:anti-anti-sigma regulatory factor